MGLGIGIGVAGLAIGGGILGAAKTRACFMGKLLGGLMGGCGGGGQMSFCAKGGCPPKHCCGGAVSNCCERGASFGFSMGFKMG